MSDIKVTPVKGGFKDKLDALIKSKEGHAEVGWFAQQGTHQTSNMTYPELAKYHATGSEGVTVRDVLRVALLHYKGHSKDELAKSIKQYLDRPSKDSLEEIIGSLGKSYWEVAHWVLGNPSALPVTNNPTPLVDTGDLKSHLARRTNKDTTLKLN